MVTNNALGNRTAEANFSVNKRTAGTTVTLSCNQSDNTNATSNSEILSQVGGANGGDPFVRWNVSGVKAFSMGIDNSDSDRLKLTDNNSPSLGNEVLGVSVATNAITFNGNYTFPTTDGTSGTVLQTDGAGNVSWQPNAATGSL